MFDDEKDHHHVPDHVITFLEKLDEGEVKILEQIINAVRSGYTVGKFVGWVVVTTIGTLVAVSQIPDAIHKLWRH